jgi:hypothetical protein
LEFSGIDKPWSKDGIYALRYDNFVIPLVKAESMEFYAVTSFMDLRDIDLINSRK